MSYGHTTCVPTYCYCYGSAYVHSCPAKHPPQEKTMSTISDREAVPILRHFKHDHLPPHLAYVSQQFSSVAHFIVMKVKNGPERQVALRKLLEAKDAAVRAVMEES